jgi:L-lactate dehydrogenase complex protein LldF
VNFAVAETGGIVVCTNEGNADLGTALPALHIASMGLEKVIPRAQDLGVFLRLLARSATGQAITSYTSHFHGPRPDSELHIILVDAGRSDLRAKQGLREALACIRCGACMNTCPVFRRSGGHSYGATIPGPIGSVLEPAKRPDRHASLPFACSVCGSCASVCPVRIELPKHLLQLRAELVSAGHTPSGLQRAVRWSSRGLRGPLRYKLGTGIVRASFRWLPRSVLHRLTKRWSDDRALPEPAAESFRSWWRKRERRS